MYMSELQGLSSFYHFFCSVLSAPIVHLVQSPRLQASKTNTTKLRMMNVPGPIVSPAPG